MPQSGNSHRQYRALSARKSATAGKEVEMAAKKKAKKVIQDDIMDSAHKVWLAGLGAVAMAEQEGGKVFSNLIEKGKKIETRSKAQTKERVDKAKGAVSGMKTVAESYWETFGRTIDDQVTTVIHRIGVPTKDEIEVLTKKVEDLTDAIDKLRTKEAASARARTTKAKSATAAKKTTAKKAAPAKKKATSAKKATTTKK
jgi:poly(hydroxyalkanoate) granule-associated protein